MGFYGEGGDCSASPPRGATGNRSRVGADRAEDGISSFRGRRAASGVAGCWQRPRPWPPLIGEGTGSVERGRANGKYRPKAEQTTSNPRLARCRVGCMEPVKEQQTTFSSEPNPGGILMHRHHCVPIQGKTIHRIPEASAPSRMGADHADRLRVKIAFRLRSARPADRFRPKMAGKSVERIQEICEKDLGKDRSCPRIEGDGNAQHQRRNGVQFELLA